MQFVIQEQTRTLIGHLTFVCPKHKHGARHISLVVLYTENSSI